MNQASEPCLAASLPQFTPKQGQYLAFIHAYTLVLGRPPAEADLQRHFRVTPPSVHQMLITYLSRRWTEGSTHAGRLLEEIKSLGYSGSYSHLARLLSPWRHAAGPERTAPTQGRTGTVLVEPGTDRTISPLVAATLCVPPRKMLTTTQAAKVDVLKLASREFATMRGLAMRFRGLLRAGSSQNLERWIKDARRSGIYAMQRFARTLRQDLEAVRNAATVSWSNGPTEGHINRLKTLKRAMYGRAGVELLRARVLPLPISRLHRS